VSAQHVQSSGFNSPTLLKKKKKEGKENKCHRCHFIHLIVKGLKRTKVKLLNYSQVTVVQQGPDETPLTFLQHLKEATRNHTTVDPELQVGEVLLKDKFLTQSPLTIHKNLRVCG
jgi:hypothetical protein